MRRRAHQPSDGGSSSPSSPSSPKSSSASGRRKMHGGGGRGAPGGGGPSCGPAAVLGTVAFVLGLCLFLMASMLDDDGAAAVTTSSGGEAASGGGEGGSGDGPRGLFKLRGGLHQLGNIGGAFSTPAGESSAKNEEEEFYCERFRPPEAVPSGGEEVPPANNDRVLLYTFRHGAGQGLGQGIGGAAFAYGMALMCNRTFKMDFMVGKYKLEDVLAGEVNTNQTRWWSLVTPEEKGWLHGKPKVTVSDFSGVKLKSDAAAYDQCQRDDVDVLVMLSYDYFPAALLSPDNFPAPYRQPRWESHLDVEQDLSGCAWSLFVDPPGGGDGDLTPMVAHLRAGDMAYHGGKGGETRKIVRTTGSVEKAAEAALKCLDETATPDDGKPCEIVFVSDSRVARDYAANTFSGRCSVRLTDATDGRPDWTSGMTLEQTRTTWDDFYLMWAAERVVITGSAFSCGAVKNYLKREGATVYRLEDEIEHGTLCTGEGHRRDFVGDRVPPLFVQMAGQCRMSDEFSYLGAG